MGDEHVWSLSEHHDVGVTPSTHVGIWAAYCVQCSHAAQAWVTECDRWIDQPVALFQPRPDLEQAILHPPPQPYEPRHAMTPVPRQARERRDADPMLEA